MMRSVTKRLLLNELDRLNGKLPEAAHLQLDYVEEYGFCLTNYRGSYNVTPRMTNKEMLQYLNGANDFIARPTAKKMPLTAYSNGNTRSTRND